MLTPLGSHCSPFTYCVSLQVFPPCPILTISREYFQATRWQHKITFAQLAERAPDPVSQSVVSPEGQRQGEKISNPSKCRARTHIFHHFNHLQFQHPLIASTAVPLSMSHNLPVGPSLLFCSGFVFANKSAPGKLGTKPPPLFYNQNPLEQPGWCPLAQFRAQYGSWDIPVGGKGLNSTNIHRPVPKNPAGGLKGAGAETGWSPLCMDNHSSGLHES